MPGEVKYFLLIAHGYLNYSFEKTKRLGLAIRSQSLADIMMEWRKEPALNATLSGQNGLRQKICVGSKPQTVAVWVEHHITHGTSPAGDWGDTKKPLKKRIKTHQ